MDVICLIDFGRYDVFTKAKEDRLIKLSNFLALDFSLPDMRDILQNNFNRALSRYVNGGCLSRQDRLVSILFPWIPFDRNAKTLVNEYHRLTDYLPDSNSSSLIVETEVYGGTNPYVLKMMEYLASNLKEDLLGAYVHGSLGTHEEIAYSDFDALAILKEEVLESPKRLAKVAQTLNQARSIMLDFDPLQHHGWFVLSEADLRCYPEAYFPSKLFRYSKSLLPHSGLELKLHVQNSFEREHQAFFKNLCDSVINRLTYRKYPKNMYQLKCLLSEFMLLPALYVQVRDNKSMYKNFCFAAAKSDFSQEDWAIMDEVSSLRSIWSYNISPFGRWVITKSTQLSGFLKSRFSPHIPEHTKAILKDSFYQRMQNLAIIMRRKIL